MIDPRPAPDASRPHVLAALRRLTIARRVTAGRISKGQQQMIRHAALLSRIQQQFGVRREVIVAAPTLAVDFSNFTACIPPARRPAPSPCAPSACLTPIRKNRKIAG